MEKQEELSVLKASGEKEIFSFEKLRNSLLRSKVPDEDIDKIIEEVKTQIYPGISTKKIYSIAFHLIKKSSPPSASRYYLKKGLMDLGPSGFPFEKYISELFKWKGYKTEVDIILQGKCVSHEIDIIGKKESTLLLAECKYKNQQGVSVDVKVPLYINSRFQDLLDNGILKKPFTKFEGWIITNSRFTQDALAFSKCKNIQLLGWDYPNHSALREIIDNSGLYPITCLTTITQYEKKELLQKGIILVSDICASEQVLDRVRIDSKRFNTILDESRKLCRTEDDKKQ